MYKLSSCCFCNGCQAIKDKKCKFILRVFAGDDPVVSWNENATDEDKDDWFLGPQFRGRFQIYIDICTGDGEIYRPGGGGGACFDVYYTDLSLSFPIFLYHDCTIGYYLYYEDPLFNYLYNGIVYDADGNEVYFSSGMIMDPPPPTGESAAAEAASSAAPQASSFTSTSSVLIGTFTATYTDEDINWENVEILPLDADDPRANCKFKYNFSVIPPAGAAIYIITDPCDSDDYSRASPTISEEGDGYFVGRVENGNCVIFPLF
jgi:hypothetical protein